MSWDKSPSPTYSDVLKEKKKERKEEIAQWHVFVLEIACGESYDPPL